MKTNQNIYYEVRIGKTRRREPALVLKDSLDYYRGFRSVYGFPDETAEIIRTQKSTRNLGSTLLYSDELLIDFDNNESAADAAGNWASAEGLDFSVWHSGGRSIHLHIAIVPMLGLAIPYKQKKFVEKFIPGADMSFYHAAGMFRLPGTFHEKNPGMSKQILAYSAGDALNLEESLGQFNFEPRYTRIQNHLVNKESQEMILNYLMFKTVNEGGRNQHAYNIARACMDLGYTFQKTKEIVAYWNSTACSPALQDMELVTTIRSAYQAKDNV